MGVFGSILMCEIFSERCKVIVKSVLHDHRTMTMPVRMQNWNVVRWNDPTMRGRSEILLNVHFQNRWLIKVVINAPQTAAQFFNLFFDFLESCVHESTHPS